MFLYYCMNVVCRSLFTDLQLFVFGSELTLTLYTHAYTTALQFIQFPTISPIPVISPLTLMYTKCRFQLMTYQKAFRYEEINLEKYIHMHMYLRICKNNNRITRCLNCEHE